MKNGRALIAEFIGTFALIYIGVGAIAANHVTNGGLGLTGIALAHGLVIAVMVSATAATSGGHLNPAVTIGALVGGHISLPAALLYILSQCLGALVAAFLAVSSFSSDALISTQLGTPLPGTGVALTQVLMAEIIATFFLVFVVYGTAIDSKAPKVGGLFIGLAVALGIMAIGPVSGGAMNPARHFGPAVLDTNFGYMWIYWVGPIIGAILAGVVYSKVFQDKR